jgi:hypothetical protein
MARERRSQHGVETTTQEGWRSSAQRAWFTQDDPGGMTCHSCGQVAKNGGLDGRAMTKPRASKTLTDVRSTHANDELLVMHHKGTFARGDRMAIMHVKLKKDGLFRPTELGATPLE